MRWGKSDQLRHAAQCSRLRFLRNGGRAYILDLEEELQRLGYDGMIDGLSAGEVVEGWKEAGWIEISPSSSELRLSEGGIEQLARWEDEDALWDRGTSSNEIHLAKRFKAGEPARNMRKLAQVIETGALETVHDPYIDSKALVTLQKLKELGVNISDSLRLLSAKKSAGTAAAALASFLRDLNTEMKSQWVVRTYDGVARPHRRFLILRDKTVITLGLSLNDLNKDEALERIPATDQHAIHDREFFENCWGNATPL